MAGLKKIAVFVAKVDDRRKVYESVRMALGITARGHQVEIFVLEDVKDKFEEIRKDKELGKNFEEFLKFLPNCRFIKDIPDFDDFDVVFVVN